MTTQLSVSKNLTTFFTGCEEDIRSLFGPVIDDGAVTSSTATDQTNSGTDLHLVSEDLVALSLDCSFPSQVSLTQYLASQFLSRISCLSKTEQNTALTKKIEPLTKSHILNSPVEILWDYFMQLPIQDLIRARQTCRYFRDVIDESFLLQTKIAHHYLNKMQAHANIPLDDMKFHLNNKNSLAVEIKNDLSVFHLTKDLSRTLPWISHLTIKNCGPLVLNPLLAELKDSRRLTSLCLQDCQVNNETINQLKAILEKDQKTYRIPVIYVCNIYNPECDGKQGNGLQISDNVHIIDSSDSGKLTMEKFEQNATDINALNELELQVQNSNVPARNVLEIYDSLNNKLRSEIISSIWHSTLMPLPFPSVQASPSTISKDVRNYIAHHPHHPSVIAAVQTCRDDFMTQSMPKEE